MSNKPITVWDKKRKKSVPIARLIMEEHIGRELNKNEIVIHKDGNSKNNDINNLTIHTTKDACDICGITNKEKIIQSYKGMYLCSKHRHQMYEYGKIIDPSPETIQDKNKIIEHNDYAEILIYNINHEYLYSAIIDLDDVEKIKQYKWHATAKDSNGKSYTETNINGQNIPLHRMILSYYGNKQVDHINRDIYDNRKQNLRIVETSINAQNKKPGGISLNKHGTWTVTLRRFCKVYYIGTYKTYEMAIAARDLFLKEFEKKQDKLLQEYMSELKYKNIQKTTSNKWNVKIRRNNKVYRINSCETLEEAILKRDELLKKLDNAVCA